MGIEMFKEILNFPLRRFVLLNIVSLMLYLLPSNPFFSKIISLGDNFGAEGEVMILGEDFGCFRY